MRKTVLVTGALSGIGYELAMIYAKEGFNLILVDKELDELLKMSVLLRSLYRVSVEVINIDMTRQESHNNLYSRFQNLNRVIDHLINNSLKTDINDSIIGFDESLIQNNVIGLMKFTKLIARDMYRRGKGKIMNIASTLTDDHRNLKPLHFAMKAFVMSYTESLSYNLNGKGINVKAFCPGPSDMQKNIENESYKNNDLFTNNRTVKEVAGYAFEVMKKNNSVAIDGSYNNILADSVKILNKQKEIYPMLLCLRACWKKRILMF